MSLDDVLYCGSNLETSPPWAVTSSRFWVVWARAGLGSPCSAPATPIAAAPLSTSRRVMSMGCTSTRWIRIGLDSCCGACGAGYSAWRLRLSRDAAWLVLTDRVAPVHGLGLVTCELRKIDPTR